MTSAIKKPKSGSHSKSNTIKITIAIVLLLLAIIILQGVNKQHNVPVSESITANISQYVGVYENFTGESFRSSLLTPYSLQTTGNNAGLYYYQQIAGQGLNFTDFYAHGISMEYQTANSTNLLGGPGIYHGAYSILISSLYNPDVTISNFYAGFGTANLTVNSQPSQQELSGSFKYLTSGSSAPVNDLQIVSYGNENFGQMTLNSGIYGPGIVIGTMANSSTPLHITVNGPNGTSLVNIYSKFLSISGCIGISATFTFGGVFDILTTYLHSLTVTSNFAPSPKFTVGSGSGLVMETSSGQTLTSDNQVEIIPPNQLSMDVISLNNSGQYYTMLTLNSPNSQVLSNGKSLINNEIFDVSSSSIRNDWNIVAGTLLGAGVASLLTFLDRKEFKN